jgi:uncharacterized protein YkwD
MKFLLALSVCLPLLTMVDVATANTNSTTTSNPAPRTNYQSRNVSASNNPAVRSVFKKIEAYRQAKGLPPMSLDDSISAQAQSHSEYMARNSNLTHEGFKQRVSSIGRVIPYCGSAENVASNMGYNNPDDIAVESWIESPGHQKNIVGNYNMTGIGVATNSKGEMFYTQIFIRKR